MFGERRTFRERRSGEDRRKVSMPVEVERRSGKDRRSGYDRRSESSLKKKPWAAIVASFFVPGAGQLYNRELLRGIVLIYIAVICLIWFSYNQGQYYQAFREMLKIEGERELAILYAKTQVKWRFVPLGIYGIIVILSAIDAYLFARYIARKAIVLFGKKEGEK